MSNTVTSPYDVRERLRVLRAVELRADGHTWQEVADLAGYSSLQTAQRAVARLLERTKNRHGEQYRDLFDAQLVQLWERTIGKLDASQASGTATGFSNLVQAAVRIIESRAKLQGANGVQRIEATVTTRSELDAEIEGLVARLNGAAPAVDQAPVTS